MNVSLTPELDGFIEQKVQSGMYQSASEVVRAGLRLLKERDDDKQSRLEQLRKEIDLGYAALERGEYIEFTSSDNMVAHIAREGKRRLAERQAK
jgi:antitoxin ParD1/3/4